MQFLFPLIDGSLSSRRESRTETVRRMAADLVKFDAFRLEADAMRALMFREYSAFDVVRYVGDAMQLAAQDVVAKEMSVS